MPVSLSPLVAVAIGDAYALPFEYRKGDYATWAHLNDGAHYERHTVYAATVPLGACSDDTQLSVAVAETMLMRGFGLSGNDDIAAYEKAFVRAFQRNPNAGYSRGMKAGFEKAIATGLPIGTVCAENGKSEKSGAAMRATPLGLIHNQHRMFRQTELQGHITHAHTALVAADAAGAAAHYMYHRLGPRHQLGIWLNQIMGEYDWATPWSGPVGSPGMESTHAAITAVMQATSLRDLLIRCVAFTGDVDTVAAIAMGAAWGYPDLPNNLPDALWEGLEASNPAMKALLVETDAQLLARYPRPAL
jgi:ADP-ribosyl-[dinitrogen reductase] hydrolase